jgi:uncharacterized repeat protein (TIGR04042 family)
MPEILFKVQWPDGSEDTCYSPSLVVKDYFLAQQDYPLAEFVERSRTALQIASDRVQAKYGSPCGMALRQLAQIEQAAARYADVPGAVVRLMEFIE